MANPPPGWYDDPARSGRLRYWDGASWTEHLRDLPGESGSGTSAVPVAPAGGAGTDAAGSTGTSATSPGPTSPGPTSNGGATAVRPPQERGAGAPGRDGAPFWPFDPAGGAPQQRTPRGTPARPAGRRAADGTLLAPWWRRLVAWAIDVVATVVMTLPVTVALLALRSDLLRSWTGAVQAASASGGELPQPPQELLGAIGACWTVVALGYFLYETVGLTRFGTTWGRQLLQIRVRAAGEAAAADPGHGSRQGRPRSGQARRAGLDLSGVSRRSGAKVAGQLVGGVPVLSDIGMFYTLVDLGRGMPDRDRRTLHDLAGGTEVVMRDGDA